MKILIGVDESPCSDAAVQFVRRLPLTAGTYVTIVSAVHPVIRAATHWVISAKRIETRHRRLDQNAGSPT